MSTYFSLAVSRISQIIIISYFLFIPFLLPVLAVEDDSAENVAKCDFYNQPDGSYVDGIVIRVVDGDTAHIEMNGKDYSVRFLGIDTPETHYLGHSQGYWGDKAAERLSEILTAGEEVRVEFDKEKCDQYGRILAHIWKDNQNVNKQMLIEGFAVSYCIAPNEAHGVEYAKIVRKSVKDKIGIFGEPIVELPYIWRREIENKPSTKYIGSLFTHKVYPPNSYEQVPIADRIFFMDKKDIVSPYYLSEF